jgi:hypothetical protein
MMNIKAAAAVITISPFILATLGHTIPTQHPTSTATFYYKKEERSTSRGIIRGTEVLIEKEVTSKANWTTTTRATSPGLYLSAITFDHEAEDVSDGIEDGQYSLQEAINALWSEYIKGSQYELPAHEKSFTPDVPGASAITIGRSACNADPC